MSLADSHSARRLRRFNLSLQRGACALRRAAPGRALPSLDLSLETNPFGFYLTFRYLPTYI